MPISPVFFFKQSNDLEYILHEKKTLYKHLIDITLLYIVHISLKRSEEKIVYHDKTQDTQHSVESLPI